MGRTTSSFIAAVGRLLLSLMFIQTGLQKLAGMDATVGYITSHGLPYPQYAYYAAVAIELGGGVLILLGLFTRLVAAAFFVFCILTAAYFHYPWTGADGAVDTMQFINFWKNISIAGGFLQLVAFGAGGLSVDALFFGGRSEEAAR